MFISARYGLKAGWIILLLRLLKKIARTAARTRKKIHNMTMNAVAPPESDALRLDERAAVVWEVEVEVEGEVGEDTDAHRQAEFPVGAVTLNVVVLVVETVTVVVVAEIVAGGAP